MLLTYKAFLILSAMVHVAHEALAAWGSSLPHSVETTSPRSAVMAASPPDTRFNGVVH